MLFFSSFWPAFTPASSLFSEREGKGKGKGQGKERKGKGESLKWPNYLLGCLCFLMTTENNAISLPSQREKLSFLHVRVNFPSFQL